MRWLLVLFTTLFSTTSHSQTNILISCEGFDITNDAQLSYEVLITNRDIYLESFDNFDANKMFPDLVVNKKVKIKFLEDYDKKEVTDDCVKKPQIGFDYMNGRGRLFVGCGTVDFHAINDSKCTLK